MFIKKFPSIGLFTFTYIVICSKSVLNESDCDIWFLRKRFVNIPQSNVGIMHDTALQYVILITASRFVYVRLICIKTIFQFKDFTCFRRVLLLKIVFIIILLQPSPAVGVGLEYVTYIH